MNLILSVIFGILAVLSIVVIAISIFEDKWISTVFAILCLVTCLINLSKEKSPNKNEGVLQGTKTKSRINGLMFVVTEASNDSTIIKCGDNLMITGQHMTYVTGDSVYIGFDNFTK